MAPSYRMNDPPPFLPPRRPSSMPNLTRQGSTKCIFASTDPTKYDTPPPFLPPRRPYSARRRSSQQDFRNTTVVGRRPSRAGTLSRPSSLPSIADTEPTEPPESGVQGSIPDRHARNTKLQAVRKEDASRSVLPSPGLRPPLVLRHSSLRVAGSVPENAHGQSRLRQTPLVKVRSIPLMSADQARPHSHPPARNATRVDDIDAITPIAPLPLRNLSPEVEDLYRLPPLPFSGQDSPMMPVLGSKPRASLSRLSSLDNLINYHEEKAQWKRASSVRHYGMAEVSSDAENHHGYSAVSADKPSTISAVAEGHGADAPEAGIPSPPKQQPKFRHLAGEVGFCFTIAMTQFLAEYLISGFALELPRLFYGQISIGPGTLGLFWPASLLSLILSATLLIFARLSDMYGGYPSFMFGVVWLTIWTLIPGFSKSSIILDVSRAMQGLAMAAFMPSTFTMVGSFYTEGPRKNFVLGLYSGCAPLGFFAGMITAGALPVGKPQWYFWIASALSFVTAVTAYLTVPHDRTDRRTLGLKMDWLGSFLITAGLILLAYALAVEPYTNQYDRSRSGFSYPMFYAPFSSGLGCLVLAVWVEGWFAVCPLLPFDFFRPRSVKAFCFAGLCFYASYGAWLYNSTGFLQSPSGVTKNGTLEGIDLALWYTPTAVGGLILCVVGGGLLHIVPVMILLLLSGLAWIAAPLLLALCPLPLNYWSAVLPSMLCATLGIDLTFTVSLVFLSSAQPKRYQGLCGAICSILVNLAMSFSLPLSEIIMTRARSEVSMPSASSPFAAVQAAVYHKINWGYQAAFIYAAASAGLGFAICVLFVRIPRSAVRERTADEERPRTTSSSEVSTLVGEREEHQGEHQGEETPVQSSELDRGRV